MVLLSFLRIFSCSELRDKNPIFPNCRRSDGDYETPKTDDPDYIYEMQRRQAYSPIKPEAVEPVEIRKKNSGWKSSGWKRLCIFNVLMWIGTTSLAGSIQSKSVKLVRLTCNIKWEH